MNRLQQAIARAKQRVVLKENPLSAYTTAAYDYVSQPWAREMLVARERAQIEDLLSQHGSFSVWLDSFGRDKLTDDVLDCLDTEDLRDIHHLFTNGLPLPPRLQMIVTGFYIDPIVEEEYEEYLDQLDDATVSKALATISSASDIIMNGEYAVYVPKPRELLHKLMTSLTANKGWTEGELSIAFTTVMRVFDYRNIMAGIFLKALDDAGITDPRNPSSNPRAVEELRAMVDRLKKYGLSNAELSSVLQDVSTPKGVRLSLVSRFRHELSSIIVKGRVVRTEVEEYESIDLPDVFDEDEDEPDEPVVTFNPEAFKKPTLTADSIQVSSEWLEERKAELQTLITVDRPRVIERLKEARELGDLSENAEYEEARNEQAFVEGRIQQLENFVKRAVVISSSSSSLVDVGTQLMIRDLANPEPYNIELVGPLEGDFEKRRVSVASPLGKSLIGLSKASVKGLLVVVDAPVRRIVYQVLSVTG